MNAIRRDEELDNIHSIYVDQWDWEKVITEQRTLDYLKETVQDIVDCIYHTSFTVRWKYHSIPVVVDRHVTFITTRVRRFVSKFRAGGENIVLCGTSYHFYSANW